MPFCSRSISGFPPPVYYFLQNRLQSMDDLLVGFWGVGSFGFFTSELVTFQMLTKPNFVTTFWNFKSLEALLQENRPLFGVKVGPFFLEIYKDKKQLSKCNVLVTRSDHFPQIRTRHEKPCKVVKRPHEYFPGPYSGFGTKGLLYWRRLSSPGSCLRQGPAPEKCV